MSIGELERLAGIADRVAFWRPFAALPRPVGFVAGRDELRRRAGFPVPYDELSREAGLPEPEKKNNRNYASLRIKQKSST